jgi:hypothetical protein
MPWSIATDKVLSVANCARGSSSTCHVAVSEAHQAWEAEGHPASHPQWDRICKQNQASRDITTVYSWWPNHALNLTLKTSDVMHLRHVNPVVNPVHENSPAQFKYPDNDLTYKSEGPAG